MFRPERQGAAAMMHSTRKGTRVYTRVQQSTGREVTVRKLRQAFVVTVENQEVEQFPTQQLAMHEADRIAESGSAVRVADE